MALGARYTKSVVFIFGGDSEEGATLQGTGFVAGTPDAEPGPIIPFVVTAEPLKPPNDRRSDGRRWSISG